MKLLYDFFPILLFFIAYKLEGIYVATAVAIIASFIQVSLFWYKHRRFEKMHLVSLALITVLGGMTLLLQEKSFIMWKPTLINWAFAAVFLGSHFIGEKSLIQRMMSSQFTLPKPIWQRLSFMWVGFFIFSGSVNIYVASDYLRAEEALRLAVPGISSEKIETLNCKADFEPALIPLCTDAKNKEEFWVNFKLFGLLGLTILFVLLQAFYLARHIQEPESEDLKNTVD